MDLATCIILILIFHVIPCGHPHTLNLHTLCKPQHRRQQSAVETFGEQKILQLVNSTNSTSDVTQLDKLLQSDQG